MTGPREAGFVWVEVAARRQPGFRNRVVRVDEVPAWARRHGGWGCYASLFLFDRGLPAYLEAGRRRGRPTVAGYDGPVWAAYWTLDLDAPDLEAALDAARRAVDRLLGPWGIGPEAVRVYFSGQKGFHVQTDLRAFGFWAPSRVVPEVLGRLTRRLTRELGEAGRFVDPALRDRTRLLRLPHTRHEVTGLFKTPLSLDELFRENPERIREAARVSRGMGTDPGLLPAGDVPVSDTACRVWEAAARGARRAAARPAVVPGPGWGECPARRALLGEPAPVGARNNTAIRIASWLRECGWGAEAVEGALMDWNRRNPEPLDDAEILHVVRSAFAPAEPYHYGCRDPLIRAHCPASPADRSRCPYHPGRAHG
ncbi:primase C-terminal domain-containing protein [Deferrisoma palaeochoriense]